MKIFTFALSLLLASAFQVLAGEKNELRLSISIPRSPNGDHILDQPRVPYFYVILENQSDGPQWLWAPWSEVADSSLSLEFTNQAGKLWTINRLIPRMISHKLPEISALHSHESLIMEIHYADTNSWPDFPKAEFGFPSISMTALYKNSHSFAEGTNIVWTGTLTSKPVNVRIYPWVPR